MRRAGGVVLLASLVSFVGACGGDDDDGSGPSKVEYIRAADAECREYYEGARRAFEDSGVPPDDVQAYGDFVLEELVPDYFATLDAIRRLEPPAGDAEAIDELLDELAQGFEMSVARIEADPKHALKIDPDFDNAQAALADYGFVDCALGAVANEGRVEA